MKRNNSHCYSQQPTTMQNFADRSSVLISKPITNTCVWIRTILKHMHCLCFLQWKLNGLCWWDLWWIDPLKGLCAASSQKDSVLASLEVGKLPTAMWTVAKLHTGYKLKWTNLNTLHKHLSKNVQLCVRKMLPVHILVLETASICNTASRMYAPPKNTARISQTSYWFHYQIWQRHNNIQVLRKLKLAQNLFHPKMFLTSQIHRYGRILYGFSCFVSFFVNSNQKSDTGSSFSWTIF